MANGPPAFLPPPIDFAAIRPPLRILAHLCSAFNHVLLDIFSLFRWPVRGEGDIWPDGARSRWDCSGETVSRGYPGSTGDVWAVRRFLLDDHFATTRPLAASDSFYYVCRVIIDSWLRLCFVVLRRTRADYSALAFPLHLMSWPHLGSPFGSHFRWIFVI